MEERDLDPDPLRQFTRWFEDARGTALPRTGGDGARNGHAGGTAVGADGAAQERGRARLHVPHELREPEGRRAQPRTRTPRCSSTGSRSAARCASRGASSACASEESEAYFRTRPLGSRLAAWASPQSRPLADRAELDRLYAEAQERFGEDVPLPPTWGGFRLVADAYEFWQHGDDRLHDRIRYERDADGWAKTRLAP